MHEEKMKTITVVTICLNAYEQLEKTIKSILEQKECNVEYIIKDGCSEDQTADIVAYYTDLIISQGHTFKFIQKKDKGVYDAMNQALEYCGKTDYILFLNAGDTLYDQYVLNQLTKIESSATILAGLTYLQYSNNMKIIAEPIFKKNEIDFCHQSILINTDIMKKYKFDTSYQISADRDLILKLINKGYTIKYLNMIISKYACNGISSRLYSCLYKELDMINEVYEIKQKRHNKYINKLKNICTKILPGVADMTAIYKKLKRTR